MKMRFLTLLALTLGMASCQTDFVSEGQAGNEVDVCFSVGAPDLISVTRADADNMLDSAYGAIDYLTNAPRDNQDNIVDWDEVDLRYSLEVYDATDLTRPIKDRMVVVKPEYSDATFNVRLIAGRKYQIVVFADFIQQLDDAAVVDADVDAQRDLGLRHTIGANLTDITIKQDKDALNDEVADAYFVSFAHTPNENAQNNVVEQTLHRPYAKVRVVATDLAELNLNVHPKYVKVEYEVYDEGVVYPTKFNAVKGRLIKGEPVEGVAEESKVLTAEYVSEIRDNRDKHVYNAGYDDDVDVNNRASALTLFTDYILAAEGTQTPINFTMTVLDENKVKIKEVKFDTQIPIQRNFLTTIAGNVLTTNTSITVNINDNFYNADKTEDEPFYEVVE